MWDDDFEDDDWEPLRSRRAGSIRIIAIVIAAAMVLTLVIPVLLRLLRGGGSDQPEPQDGVRALVVEQAQPGTLPT